MSTKSEVIALVLDALYRDDLTSQASTAIDMAIARRNSESWWFLQQRKTSNTVDGQEYLELPSDFGTLDDLTITDDTRVMRLYEVTLERMNDLFISGSDYKGLPVYFCLYDGQIRLHPIPDDAYTVTMYYNAEPGELSAAGSNVWTTTAKELTMREAAADVAATVLMDDKRAMTQIALRDQALAALRRENTTRLMSGYSRKRRC